MIKMIHSYWAYIVLIVLILAVANAILGLTSKKKFEAKDLIVSSTYVVVVFSILVQGMTINKVVKWTGIT